MTADPTVTERILGIDEAGRGCVLGSLIVGGFIVEHPCDAALRAAGARDSKTLSPARRVLARARLAELGTADIRVVTASEIDAGNLNALEEAVIVALIRQWRPHRVFMDALGHPNTIPKLIKRLSTQLGDLTPTPIFVVEPKADGTYPVVGAASIFAKTTRDALLDELRDEFGDLGSGYPSDPKTKRWLGDWASTGRPWPDFVRTRWGTIKRVGQLQLFRNSSTQT